jgi:tRNA threonylcarbamoyladenosine biosynthesis protein TsaB
MKLSLNTSSSTTILELDDKHYEWDSGRNLARDLLSYIHDKLQENNADWQDISEIHFFSGPGSFTGLRIGACVANTLADQLGVPLYNQRGAKMDIILPEYGREANISKPKK